MNLSASTIMGILYWLYWIIVVSIIIKVMLRNRDAVKTLAWIMVFIFMPFLGLVLYFFFGRDTRKKRLVGKRLLSQIKQHTAFRTGGGAKKEIPPEYQTLATFFENASSASFLPFDEARVIPDTRVFAERLFEMISTAENHIHLQFYIIEDDEFAEEAIRNAIERAALRELIEDEKIHANSGCSIAALDVDKNDEE